MANKNDLTPEEIALHSFQKVPEGYRPEEVDTFIDQINEQLANNLTTIKELNKIIVDKNSNLDLLRQENEELKQANIKSQKQQIEEVRGAISSKKIVKKISDIEHDVSRILDILDTKKTR